MKKTTLAALALLSLSLYSCKDKDKPANPAVTKGAYVLSEGTFANSVSKLAKIDLASGSVAGNYFASQNNGTEIGNLANDMLMYGSHIFVALNVSNNIAVMRASDAVLEKRLGANDFSGATGPRYLAAANGKVFASFQNNRVLVIDTATLTVSRTITVGSNPEQLTTANNKLFVTNSGGFNFPNYDSTVSIVNLSDYSVSKIRVGLNPAYAVTGSDGNVFVGYYGDFGAVKPGIVKINASTNAIVARTDSAAGKMMEVNGKLYVAAGYAGGNRVMTYNSATLAFAGNLVTDGTVITSPYSIGYDNVNNNVWVGDAMDYQAAGRIFVFNTAGKKINTYNLSPGVNPNTILFYR